MNQQSYDNSIKGIFKEDAEELIPILLEGARFTNVFDIEVLRPPMRTDSTYGILYQGRSAILQMEFQAGEDEDIVYRSLIYHAGLLRDYRLPIISIIVYLFKATGNRSPLRETIGNEELLVFHFRVIEIWSLDARKYIARREISMYPLLPAMSNADAELLLQAIDELVARYKYNEAKLARRLLWLSVFLYRTQMVSSQDKKKVRERLDAFEYLLENDEFVQKQRALGFSQGEEKGKIEGKIEGRVEGEIAATRQVLQTLVKKLYPSLAVLAEQRVEQTQKVDALRTVIGLIVEAPDEATARAVLDSLLTA